MNRLCVLLLALPACNTDSTVNSSTGVAACATAIACGILDPVGTHGISGCTAQALQVNDPLVAAIAHFSTQMVNCIAAAGANCDNAKKCLGGGVTPAPCSGNSRSCEGAVLSFCTTAAGSGGTMGVQKFNCGDVAEMCVANGAAIECGFGTCAGGNNMCVGTKVQLCQNGIVQQYDCSNYGDTCVAGVVGPHCRGTGATCQTTSLNLLGSPLRCDGNVLVRCADSQESRLDCAARNQVCVANVNGQTFDCALGNSCDPSTFSATCAGTVLSYCNDGVLSTYDCAAAGFKGCAPDNGGRCTT
jgi:hypothetical protein